MAAVSDAICPSKGVWADEGQISLGRSECISGEGLIVNGGSTMSHGSRSSGSEPSCRLRGELSAIGLDHFISRGRP